MKDYVLFEMPTQRERQFVAMAVVQHYLHTYEDRHKLPNTPKELADSEIYYRVNMSAEDWGFFSQIGLKLRHRQKIFDTPDMIVDLRDIKAKMFEDFNERRHLAEIYGIMSGVPCRSIPIITFVEATADQNQWVTLDDFRYKNYRNISSQQLAKVRDGEVAGVIGYQSWGTYLAAARQLPLIEILPADRNRNRLSKWDHTYYRMVEQKRGNIPFQIEQGMTNLQQTLREKPLVQEAMA